MGINESKQDLDEIRQDLDDSLKDHIRLLKNNGIELEIKNSDLLLACITHFNEDPALEALKDLIYVLHRLDYHMDNRGGLPPTTRRQNHSIIVDGNDLLHYKYLELTNTIGKSETILCFFIFYCLAARRFLLFMNKNSKDSLNVYLGKILEQDIINTRFLKESLENLRLRFYFQYKDMFGATPNFKDYDIYYFIFKSLSQHFLTNNDTNNPKELKETLLKAAKNDLVSIPKAAAFKGKDAFDKQKIRTDYSRKQSGENEKKMESASDDPQKLEDTIAHFEISDILDKIKDPINKEIAILKFVAGLTDADIAKKIKNNFNKESFSQQAVNKRLKKLNPSLKKYLS